MEQPKHGSDMGSSQLDKTRLKRVSDMTISHYDRSAEYYWDGTRDHDVSQNYSAFLAAIKGDGVFSILDFLLYTLVQIDRTFCRKTSTPHTAIFTFKSYYTVLMLNTVLKVYS